MLGKDQKEPVDFDILEQINLNAAGADIGAEEIWVTVPANRTEVATRSFKTYTVELHKIGAWLRECGVDTLAMESTGVYWIPLFEILESEGIEVYLVNARHIKNVTGRKDDISDSQWIQQLHTYGLLQASFRPEEQICVLRALVRQRTMLIQQRTSHIQHMQKALQQMNLKLTMVLSDITGVTGMKIIRAILAGEREPAKLASYRNGRCKHSEEEIQLALDGNYRHEHVFSLQQAVQLYDFYGQLLAECDQQIEGIYINIDSFPTDQSPPKANRQKPRKNQPDFDLRSHLFRITGVDLTAIDGIDALTAQTVISEIGLDMSRWPTHKHFGSWLGLAPRHKITGGHIKSRRTAQNANRAATALRVASQSLWNSKTALGGFYKRLRAKHGPAKATTATAYKLARIIYHMLKEHTVYQDPGISAFEHQHRQRAVRKLHKTAARLGFSIAEVPA